MQFSGSSMFYVLCTFIKFESVFYSIISDSIYSIISDSIFAFLSIQSLSTNAATAFDNLLTAVWTFERVCLFSSTEIAAFKNVITNPLITF